MLTRMGHSVDVVANGAEAVAAAARSDAYDIVLMDMQMPVMDGPDATREIRRLGGAWAKTPVIALTADMIPGNRTGYFASGINAIVGKPIDWAELDAEIGRLIAGPTAEGRIPLPQTQDSAALLETSHATPETMSTAPETVPAPAAPADDAIILDGTMLDSLIAALGADVFTPMLVTFRASMAQYQGDLEAAVAAGDLKKAKRTAHALKGLCAQFGAPRASDLAKFIEVDSKDLAEIRPVLAKIAETIDATARALDARFPQIPK
jgi:CheY-like chemotaxis protein